jgi:stage II sporulation protein AA (anti-sigma F factor antagonist)
MKFEHKQIENSKLLLSLSGDFDAVGANGIRSQLQNICESTSADTVVFDIGEVQFIDSSGIGAIVFLFKRLKEKGRQLRIISAQGQPAQLLQLLRVHKAIPVEMAAN